MLEIASDRPEHCELDTPANPFASVSLSCGDGACGAARAMAGKRHLLEEAPDLPLPACSAKTCNCHYFRYGDRRNLLGNRRFRLLEGRSGGLKPHRAERRRGQDRRQLKIKFL